jgi:hypothetical protein
LVVKDWWSKTGEMDAISLAETIPDIPERGADDGKGIIGADDGAADVPKLEVRDASWLQRPRSNRSRTEFEMKLSVNLLPIQAFRTLRLPSLGARSPPQRRRESVEQVELSNPR